MAGPEPRTHELPPTPIVGLLVVGALLILAEGLYEVGTLDQASVYGLTVPSSFWAVPVLTILLAILLFLLTWRYRALPSWGLGVVFIVLGMLSFILGAGFLVGGILILIAGALACFAEWVEELAHRTLASRRAEVAGTAGLARGTEPPRGTSTPSGPGGIVIYRRCSTCGELIRQEFTVCPSCGKPIGS